MPVMDWKSAVLSRLAFKSVQMCISKGVLTLVSCKWPLTFDLLGRLTADHRGVCSSRLVTKYFDLTAHLLRHSKDNKNHFLQRGSSISVKSHDNSTELCSTCPETPLTAGGARMSPRRVGEGVREQGGYRLGFGSLEGPIDPGRVCCHWSLPGQARVTRGYSCHHVTSLVKLVAIRASRKLL